MQHEIKHSRSFDARAARPGPGSKSNSKPDRSPPKSKSSSKVLLIRNQQCFGGTNFAEVVVSLGIGVNSGHPMYSLSNSFTFAPF